MKNINLLNIEDYMYLFQNDNKNFNNINWVEPIFIGMLKAYSSEKNISIETDNSYIQNMFSNSFKVGKSYSPLENIPNTRIGLETISTHLTKIMLKNFNDISNEAKKDLNDYLQYLFLEIMNNVADHAVSSIGGYTMAQYYPLGNKIQFVVADRGVAFLENMKLNFKDIKTEEEAINKALEKGITSTKQKVYGQSNNAGYGLYAMSKILEMTGGRYVIISNDTLLRYIDEKKEIVELKKPWEGVVVAFEFFESEINFDMDFFTRNYLWNIEEEDEDFY